MGIMSQYLENKILDHLLCNSSYSPPSNIYIALYTRLYPDIRPEGEEVAKYIGTTPGPTPTINTTYPTGYERAVAPAFSISSTTSVASFSDDVFFSEAVEDWGKIYSIRLMDAYTGGNTLFSCNLTSPITITKGETFQIPANASSFSINLMAYGSKRKTGNFSVWSASAILDHVLNGNTFPSPGTDMWMGLGSGMTISLSTLDGTLNELAKTGYSRQKTSGSNWGIPSSNPVFTSSRVNKADIVFSESISVEWERIANFALFNSQTSGSIILWGTMNSMFLIVGDGLKFSSERIKVILD